MYVHFVYISQKICYQTQLQVLLSMNNYLVNVKSQVKKQQSKSCKIKFKDNLV